MKTTIKSMVMLLSVATAVTLTSCGGNSNSNSGSQYQETQETETRGKTYSFCDGEGTQWTLKVDGSNVELSGNGNTYYGSKTFGCETIHFSKHLYITANNAITTSMTGQIFDPEIHGNYLYYTILAANANDPTQRFELR